MAEQDVAYAWIQIQTADGATYPFAIDPASYVKRDIVDFAPRAGGGDVVYSNLDLYQIVTQDSWHHGLGFVQFRDKFGYRITSDGVDTRPVGMAMMFPKRTLEQAIGTGPKRVVDFGGNTYLLTLNNGVWKRTPGGVYTLVYNQVCNDLISNGSYLIVTSPGLRTYTSSNGTSWTAAGVAGNPPNNFDKLVIHNGFMWGSESATATKTLSGTYTTGMGFTATAGVSYNFYGTNTVFMSEIKNGDIVKIGSTVVVRVKIVLSNTVFIAYVMTGGTISGGESFLLQTPGTTYDCVHFWSSADSSDAEGGGIADIGAIVVGTGGAGIKAMASFNGSLHIARPDGVWAIDDTVTPPVARRVLSFVDEAHSSNFAIFTPWRGRLYFNIKNTLYAYNGSSLANVTPPTYSLDYPPAAFGGFVAATYRGPYLYVIASNNSSTPTYYLLAFDGTGWFLLLDLGTSSSGGLGYSALLNMLFIQIGVNSEHVPFQVSSELPYADFATTGNHHLNLSEIDFGFRRVKKSFAEIDVEVYNVAAGRYVAVDYSADGGAWQRLSHTTANGVTKMNMNPTVEANKLDVRCDFHTGSATESPLLRNITIKAMIRPDTLFGHQFMVVGGNEIRMLDDRFNPGSSEQQRQWIEAIRNSKAPVTMIDPFGVSHSGYVSTSQFIDIQRRPEERQSSWNCRLNFVEVR